MKYNLQLSLGAHVRQLRRQQHITQAKLGGKHFSKSYVSAIELDKLVPTAEALRFFAGQLHLQPDYFLDFQNNDHHNGHVSVFSPGVHPATQKQSDTQTLLNNWLDTLRSSGYSTPKEEPPDLTFQAIESLSLEKRACYYFLHGLSAQKKQAFEEGQANFELALAFASDTQRPAIIDALGVNHYLLKQYNLALEYHLRSRTLLDQLASDQVDNNLLFQLELHCANAYFALGNYQYALNHYEDARQHMHSQNDIQTAGNLYWKLGICHYMCIYLKNQFLHPTLPTPEETEQSYQSAIGFLIQSRTLYQVSRDKQSETYVRLTLSHVLLEFSKQREYNLYQSQSEEKTKTLLKIASLLEEAREQCRQVILSWQEYYSSMSALPAAIEDTIINALAQLIRIFTMRATAARITGYTSTALKELIQACALWQQAQESLQKKELPFLLLQKIISAQALNNQASSLSLPYLYDLKPEPARASGQAEFALSAAMLAEEMGNAAQNEDYALICYQRANHFLSRALDNSQHSVYHSEFSRNFLLRMYQRCIFQVERRLRIVKNCHEQTSEFLLLLYRQALFQRQPILVQER